MVCRPAFRTIPIHRGFTLVEMLVVVLLLAIGAGVAVATIGPDERRVLEREAMRVATALEHATAAAQWRNETLGMSAEGNVYRFWRRDGEGEWQVLTTDEVLAPRALPQGVTMHAERYAGASIDPAAIIPLRPSGRNEPYRIGMTGHEWALAMETDPLNRIRWQVARRATGPS